MAPMVWSDLAASWQEQPLNLGSEPGCIASIGDDSSLLASKRKVLIFAMENSIWQMRIRHSTLTFDEYLVP
jgi:hypothetical protein